MKVESLIIRNFPIWIQLEPGMGYAPSTGTGNDGLIVVDSLEETNRAIDLIIDQVSIYRLTTVLKAF
jgi:hypothetical protein